MAWGRYKRRYNRYRRYPARRFWRRYYRYRYARKFANGSSRSTIRVKVPCTGTDSAVIASGSNTSTTYAINPWVGYGYQKTSSGVTTALGNIGPTASPLYQSYTNLYDQVKCIGCKVRLSVTSPVGGSAIPSLQIAHGWDRNLTYQDIGKLPTFDELQKGATGMLSTALNNSIAKLQRSCYASDLIENAAWHDATLTATTPPHDAVWDGSRYSVPFFSPSFMFSFKTPTITTGATIAFSLDVMWYFAFRNPKYGGSASNSKLDFETIEAKNIPAIDIDDEIDMEEEQERPQVRAKHTKLLTDTDAGPLTAGKKRYPKNASSNRGQLSGD